MTWKFMRISQMWKLRKKRHVTRRCFTQFWWKDKFRNIWFACLSVSCSQTLRFILQIALVMRFITPKYSTCFQYDYGFKIHTQMYQISLKIMTHIQKLSPIQLQPVIEDHKTFQDSNDNSGILIPHFQLTSHPPTFQKFQK